MSRKLFGRWVSSPIPTENACGVQMYPGSELGKRIMESISRPYLEFPRHFTTHTRSPVGVRSVQVFHTRGTLGTAVCADGKLVLICRSVHGYPGTRTSPGQASHTLPEPSCDSRKFDHLGFLPGYTSVASFHVVPGTSRSDQRARSDADRGLDRSESI